MNKLSKEVDKQVYKTALGADNDEVIIGDEKSLNFKPQIELKRWNGENFLRIKFSDLSLIPVLNLQTSELKAENTEIGFYVKDSPLEEVLKYGLILNKKPPTNKFMCQLEGWEDFDFFYQGFVRNPVCFTKDGKDYVRGIDPFDDDITDCTREVKNEGSYAVFHKEKKNYIVGVTPNYQQGKFCHIPRPKVIDKNGKWAWVSIHIENGVYEITAPQDFLDTAIYPIIFNDEFGYHPATPGSSGGAGLDEVYASGKGVPTSNGTVTNISLYCSTGSGITKIWVGLYQDSGGGVPSAIVGSEYDNGDPGTLSAGWHDFTSNALSVVSGTTYWNAANSAGGDIIQYYDISSGTQRAWDTHTAGDPWPATFTVNSSSAAKYSMYATYTPSGGAIIQPIESDSTSIFFL